MRIGKPDIGRRTYLVNRTKIGCMTAMADELVSLYSLETLEESVE